MGINDSGVIVGWYTTPTTGFTGFILQNGTFHKLNVLNAPTELRGISDAGNIVGLSHTSESGESFLRKSNGMVELIVVPKPSPRR